MTVAAVMLARDEADVIGYTVAHLLAEGVDHVVVGENLSEDDTPRILAMCAESHPVTVVPDDNPEHVQDVKMTDLARFAHDELGADWIIACDADEVWYSKHGTLGEFFESCEVDVVTATGWDHIVTDDDDVATSNPFLRINHRRQVPQRLGKVAFRWHDGVRIDHGNHFVFDHPGRAAKALNYRHYQYRTFEQMVDKVRTGAEAMRNMHPMYGTHWREAAAKSDDELWREWRRLCEESGLIRDPAPVRSL